MVDDLVDVCILLHIFPHSTNIFGHCRPALCVGLYGFSAPAEHAPDCSRCTCRENRFDVDVVAASEVRRTDAEGLFDCSDRKRSNRAKVAQSPVGRLVDLVAVDAVARFTHGKERRTAFGLHRPQVRLTRHTELFGRHDDFSVKEVGRRQEDAFVPRVGVVGRNERSPEEVFVAYL